MRQIVTRGPRFPFDHRIPKYWMRDNTFGTALSNGLNLLFPMGERFFVRSVRQYVDRIADDPELLAQVKAFSGQEGHHARAHEQQFALMREQGWDPDRFLRVYKKIAYGIIEPIAPATLCLSVTVALEHFTASFAASVIDDGSLDDVHPVMRDLIRWHAAEEIEHKAVAFDVLQRVDASYGTRIAGLVVGGGLLLFFWYLAAAMLTMSNDQPAHVVVKDAVRAFRSGQVVNGDFAKAFVGYLRRDFHPWDLDNSEIAATVVAEIEARDRVRAA